MLGRGVSGLGLQLFRNGVLSGLGLDWTELMILALSILFSAWVTIHNQKEDMRVTLEKKADLAALDRTVCAAVLCDFAGENTDRVTARPNLFIRISRCDRTDRTVRRVRRDCIHSTGSYAKWRLQ